LFVAALLLLVRDVLPFELFFLDLNISRSL
jgi:hypothetical protein